MSINLHAKTDYSNLFSSLNTGVNKNALTDMSWLSDYASIKSGTYSKLMKAYYSSDASKEVSSIGSKQVRTTSEETTKYTKAASAADSVQSSLTDLSKLKADSDKDDLYNAVNSYVKNYNAMLENAADTTDNSIDGRINTIKGYTADNADALGRLGISITTKGGLKLDKDTFDQADKSDIETLFAAKGSYGYSVSVSAGMIQSTASYDAARTSTYTNTGSYSSVVGSMWDSTT